MLISFRAKNNILAMETCECFSNNTYLFPFFVNYSLEMHKFSWQLTEHQIVEFWTDETMQKEASRHLLVCIKAEKHHSLITWAMMPVNGNVFSPPPPSLFCVFAPSMCPFSHRLQRVRRKNLLLLVQPPNACTFLTLFPDPLAYRQPPTHPHSLLPDDGDHSANQ